MATNPDAEWIMALRRMQARAAKERADVEQRKSEGKTPGAYQRKPSKPGRWKTRPDWFCSATNQAGLPCQMLAIHDNGRCKWHGGLSTGPKTEAGKEQARINGRKGGRPRKKPKS